MRFEITCRNGVSPAEQAALLREHGFAAANVTDTSREFDAVGFGAALLKASPELDIMVHAAAKHHPTGTQKTARESYGELLTRGVAAGLRKYLVVSGHPRREFDALAALPVFVSAAPEAEAYCVHNPFFACAGHADRQSEEDERLERKLASDRVRGVCLQIGLDPDAVRGAVRRIRAARPAIEVLGSLPIPSAGLAHRLATKVLHGVFLPPRFFLSAKAAEREVGLAHERFIEEGITPVVFAFDCGRGSYERAAAMRDRAGR